MSSSDQSDQSELLLGNTKPVAKTISLKKKWVFTLNNWKVDQYDQLINCLKNGGYKYVIGKEVGESGTPHLQGYIEHKKRFRPSSIKDLPFDWSKAHWEKAKGSMLANCQYCSKDGEYDTNIEDVFFLPKYSLDIELWPWQKWVWNLIKDNPDDRTIYWVWEPDGNKGKTLFQKYCFLNSPRCVVLSGKCDDMKNGIIEYVKKNGYVPRTILVNIPRVSQNHLSIAGLESIKDMFFYCGKYEGGMICDRNPHVFVFANEEPIRDEMSQDRWQIINLNDLTEL